MYKLDLRAVVGCGVVVALAHCGDDGVGGGSTGDGTTTAVATETGVVTTGGGPTTGDVPTGGEGTAGQTTGGPTTMVDETTSTSTSTTGDDTTSGTADTGTSEATTGEPPPVCGDGVVGGEEACDDGNADDTDTCTSACMNAACGDGFVGPGEGCDDGNAVDDDACSNACALASCGDGAVQAGEACDDGNAMDDDACLPTCVAASCGDGAVQAGVEACDDGNASDDDACVGACVAASCGDGFVQAGVEGCDDGNAMDDDTCTGLCAAPACDDGLKSGDESDVDCGGGCPGCEVSEGCVGPGDCVTDTCDQGVCVYAPSCKAIKQSQPGAADGMYEVDPDGGGPGAAFFVYCDMTTDGGGWGLAMRFAPTQGQFHFYSPHWTMQSLVNEGNPGPTEPLDGKFPAFNALPGGEIRGCLKHPQTQQYGCKAYALPMPTTLLGLFTTVPVGSDIAMKGLFFNETQAAKTQWLTIQGRTIADASVVPGYYATGINIDDDQSCYDARVRFGLVLNNEANITTLNDAAGFGAQAYYTAACDLQPGVDAPWKTACGFQSGPTTYQTAGQIWIR